MLTRLRSPAVAAALVMVVAVPSLVFGENGYWERGPAEFPHGQTVRGDRDVLDVEQNRSVKTETVARGTSQEGIYRYSASWTEPPSQVAAGEKIVVAAEMATEIVRRGVGGWSSLDAWIEGYRRMRPPEPDKVWLTSDRGPLRAAHEWLFKAPPGKSGEEFTVVLRPYDAIYTDDILVVYRYRWVGSPIQVRARLHDGDHQFTIADEAVLKLELENRSDTAFDELVIRCEIVGELGDETEPTLYFPEAADATSIERTLSVPLPANGTIELELTLRSAGLGARSAASTIQWRLDRKLWSQRNLVLTKDPGRKPKTEQSHPLDRVLQVVLRGRQSNSSDSEMLYKKTVPIKAGFAGDESSDEIVSITYPDFRSVVGLPKADEAALKYYMEGDTRKTGEGFQGTVGEQFVRALAIRAARYGSRWTSVGERPDGDPRLPEDVEEIAHNVAWFVFQALMPKGAPAVAYEAQENAQAIFNAHYGFGVTPPELKKTKLDRPTFVCQENAQLFGQLMRALGFPARDINVMCFYYPYDVGIAWEKYQDAASEVWLGRGWSFWGLYRTAPLPEGRPFRDPVAWYEQTWKRFDLYEATAQFHNSDKNETTRFNVGEYYPQSSRLTWESSGVWRRRGIFTEKRGWKTAEQLRDEQIERDRISELVQVSIHSPAVLEVELPDGRRLGLRQPISGDPQRWLLQDGRPGLVDDIPGGVFLPAGLPYYHPDGVQHTHQTVRFELPVGVEADDVKVRLTGTDDGPYRLEMLRTGEAGLQSYEIIAGTASRGSTELRNLGEFVPRGPPAERPVDRQSAEPPASGKAYLGVTAHEIDLMTSKIHGVPAGAGALISQVRIGSPAHRAGLANFDVISQIAGHTVRSRGDVVRILAGFRPGQSVRLDRWRAGSVEVVLGNRTDRQDAQPKGQRVLLNQRFDRITAEVRKMWSKGFRLTSLAGRNGRWTAVLSQGHSDRLDGYATARSLSEAKDRLSIWWDAGWSLQSLACDGETWVLWFHKNHRQAGQRVTSASSRAGLEKKLAALLDEGYLITTLAYGRGQWAAGLTRRADQVQSVISVASTDELTLAIRRQWKMNRVITDAARNGDEWMVIMSESPAGKQRWARSSSENLREKVQTQWEDGYGVAVHCAGSRTWFLTFLKGGGRPR